jgi:hypothetical protein
MVLKTEEAPSAGALRLREWRRRRRANRRQRCGCCEAIFTPSRADQAFCSSPCRQRGYRRRRKAGEPASSRATAPPWRELTPARLSDTASRSGAAQRPALHDRFGRVIDIASLIG